MIDRKTALICAALTALMFAAALWRVTSPEEWPPHTVWTARLLPSMLFVFPAFCALMTGGLYWRSFRASTDPRFEPWSRWGKRLSVSYCAGFSLLHGYLVAQSFGLHLPSAIGPTLAVLMVIAALLAINQKPKLPWLEWYSFGGSLGPIYGPRFVRIQSKVALVFGISVLGFAFAAPGTPETRFTYVVVMTALFLLEIIALRIHLARKWRLKRATRG
jgi:hypothetical protein